VPRLQSAVYSTQNSVVGARGALSAVSLSNAQTQEPEARLTSGAFSTIFAP
jgi:hypothetical protein